MTGIKLPRRWPLLAIVPSSAVAVWSGWVGLGEMAGFGPVTPLPGITDWTINTAITLPIGVEAYAAYALHAALSPARLSERTRRFAWISSIGSLTLGALGQVAYHLLIAAGRTDAPWQVTTLVSILPVLVLGMAASLAHMVRADHDRQQDQDQSGPAGSIAVSPARSAEPDQSTDRDQHADRDQDQSGPALPAVRELSEIERYAAMRAAEKVRQSGQPITRRNMRDAGFGCSNDKWSRVAAYLRHELPDDFTSRAA